MAEKFYLLDLERTGNTGMAHFWKQNRFGYTTDIKEAGLFSPKEAQEIIESDMDELTVKIADHVIKF